MISYNLPTKVCYNTKCVSSMLISDSNDSSNWTEHRIQLPEGEWSIYSQNKNIIYLKRKLDENSKKDIHPKRI